MTESAPFIIEAIGAQADRGVFAAACEQLQAALFADSGSPWPIRLQWHDQALEPCSVIVVSLLPECARVEESWPDTEVRLRHEFQALATRGAAVFVCTIFRQVSQETADVPAQNLLERIRRLNLLAAGLSHDLGIYVVDINRILAGVGGRTLACDWTLQSPMATRFAGHAVASTLVAAGLDECFSPDMQERAKERLAEARPEIPRAVELAVSPITLGFQAVRNGKRRQVFAQHSESFLPQSLSISERWRRLRGQLENGQLTAFSAAVVMLRSAARIVRNRLSFSRGTRE